MPKTSRGLFRASQRGARVFILPGVFFAQSRKSLDKEKANLIWFAAVSFKENCRNEPEV